MGSTEAHRHTEALGRSHGDIGAEFARRREEREREQVGGGDEQPAGVVNAIGEIGVIVDSAVSRRILNQHAAAAGEIRIEVHHIDDTALNANRLGAGFDDGDGLRMAVGGDEEGGLVRDRVAHRHGLGGGGGFVEQAGVGQGKRGEVGDHGLEIQQRFQTPLRNFGLIRGVLRVPAGVFEDVSLNDRRGDGVAIPHADVRLHHAVFRREALQLRKHLPLPARQTQRQWTTEPDRLGHGLIDELIEAVQPEDIEHSTEVVGARADVTTDQRVG